MNAALLERPETGIDSLYMTENDDGQLDDQRRQVLAQALRDWRSRRGLSQMDAARELGVSYRAYQQYEAAQVLPHAKNLRKIIEGVGMNWDEWRDRVFEPIMQDRISELRAEFSHEVEGLRKEFQRQIRELRRGRRGEAG